MSTRMTTRTAGSAIVVALLVLFAPGFPLVLPASLTPHPPQSPPQARSMTEHQPAVRAEAGAGGPPAPASDRTTRPACDDGTPSGRPGDPSPTRDRHRVAAGDSARRGPAPPPGGAVRATGSGAGGGSAAGTSSRRGRRPTAHAPAVLQVFRC
ncbi:hypothetical protein [Streptomyces sp. NPDC059015]|uniref:hypothetical protein n=1 Tax=unclassified Streptomyces TaxID=2593676 RepID=UPI0036A3C401